MWPRTRGARRQRLSSKTDSSMRLPARFLLTGAAVIAASSCYSDGSLSPAGAPLVSGNRVLRALVIAQSVDFVVPTNGGTFNLLDAYTLHVPANAVCDPNAADTQAGYASQAWDSPCTVATGNINVRATLKWTGTRLYVDFQPALRFVPSKTVTLATTLFAPTVQAYDAAGVTEGWSIGYSHGIGQAGVDDALNDPSLRTVIVGSSGKIFRRVKHFSGYLQWTGGGYIPCEPSESNPLCVWVADEGEG